MHETLRDEEALSITFPREFQTAWWEALDRRFTIILIATMVVNFSLILYLVANPPPRITENEVARLQKQFAKLVLDKEAEPAETQFVEAGTEEASPDVVGQPSSGTSSGKESAGGQTKTGGGPSGGSGPGGGEGGGPLGSGQGRGRSRAQISQEVSHSGILGLLTSSEGEGGGDAASEILGGGRPGQSLDAALAGVSGIKSSGKGGTGEPGTGGPGGGHGVRGGREIGGGGIDAMVEGLGKGESKGVARTGDLLTRNEEPLIEAGDVQTAGGRDQAAIAAIISAHTPAIQYCYQKELKRNPTLQGKFVVRFVIAPQGTVESVTVLSSTLNNKTVEECIVNRIKRWDDFGAIDPSKGTSTIRQVYTFGY